jgi:hypothetical protein
LLRHTLEQLRVLVRCQLLETLPELPSDTPWVLRWLSRRTGTPEECCGCACVGRTRPQPGISPRVRRRRFGGERIADAGGSPAVEHFTNSEHRHLDPVLHLDSVSVCARVPDLLRQRPQEWIDLGGGQRKADRVRLGHYAATVFLAVWPARSLAHRR